jgi:hypothetical protein
MARAVTLIMCLSAGRILAAHGVDHHTARRG